MISNINAFYGIIDSWIMTTLGLELGSGNLGFNGLLVKSVLEGLTNFNAIDENTCLKRPRVSIRSLYLPEVHCSVFPVPLDSTSPQAQWHIGVRRTHQKTLLQCRMHLYGNKRRQLFLFCFNINKNQGRAVCLQLRNSVSSPNANFELPEEELLLIRLQHRQVTWWVSSVVEGV